MRPGRYWLLGAFVAAGFCLPAAEPLAPRGPIAQELTKEYKFDPKPDAPKPAPSDADKSDIVVLPKLEVTDSWKKLADEIEQAAANEARKGFTWKDRGEFFHSEGKKTTLGLGLKYNFESGRRAGFNLFSLSW